MSGAKKPTNEDFNKVFASIQEGHNNLYDTRRMKEEAIRISKRKENFLWGFMAGVVFSAILIILSLIYRLHGV